MMVRKLVLSLAAAGAATLASAQMKPSAVAPQTPLPMAVFGRLPTIEAPEISPDGAVLAAKVRGNGEQYLAVVRLDQPDAKPDFIARDGTFGKLGNVRTVRWRWVDSDNLLA
jgi:hypothetical protein